MDGSLSLNFSVGDSTIDKQHLEFLRRLEALGSVIDPQRVDAAVIGNSLQFLEDYANDHFRGEELMMKRGGYPYVEQHAREHKAFHGVVAQFKEHLTAAHQTGGAQLRELTDWMTGWLISHIYVSDKRYARYFQEHPSVLPSDSAS